MQSMSYGIMPDRTDFELAFERECPDGYYDISHGSPQGESAPGDDLYTCAELWDELQRLRELFESGDDEAGDWCSSILQTLDFEWI